jgi:hypothetical protein
VQAGDFGGHIIGLGGEHQGERGEEGGEESFHRILDVSSGSFYLWTYELD